MAIIRDIPEYKAPYEVMLNLFPDQFLDDDFGKVENGKGFSIDGYVYPMPKQHTNKESKLNPAFWKINMDYFYTVGLAQYNYQRHKIVGNYELLKGKLSPRDFYVQKNTPVFDLMDKLIEEAGLPAYVVHYPILNPPINTMVGEMSKRKDSSRPKAMDDNSLAEQLQYYSELYLQLITDTAKAKISQKLMAKGADISNLEEFNQKVEQMTEDKIKEYKTNFTSEAEIWATNIINVLKVEFNTKELFEEGFRDMLICNKQFYHIYENKTKTGFALDCLNPKNVWWLTSPDKKYTRDAYAAGIIEIMELSEIINKYDLSIEEIDHLRKYAMMAFFPYSRESNALRDKQSLGNGVDSIRYDTYDPLIVEERNRMEAMIQTDNGEALDGFLGNASPNVGTFGNRFVVTTAYWISKRKVGLLTYIDKDGTEQTDLVDDNYHDGDHPQEISIEWDWKNQWFKGVKIGDDIYNVEPLECLDYCPIIGVSHEIKNSISVSLLDLMKPLQTIYNVCWNQIYHLLEKEKGMVLIMNKRFIPLLKGADYKDSESIFMRRAEEEGVIWIDDSPDNTKGASSFNQFTIADWTLSKQIESRLQLALAVKNECWELIGISKQRQGTIQASETATATNTALSQSYAQTEPYFVQHEYLINQVLQAVLDVAKYVTCKNPESTIGLVNSEGGSEVMKIMTANGLSNKDIKLFMTSRAEDQTILQKIQDLSQHALQNGVPFYEVAISYQTTSVRKLMDLYKKLKDQNEKMAQTQQEIEQKKQQAEEQKNQADQAFIEKQHQDEIKLKVYETDTKSNTDLTIAKMQIAAEFAKDGNTNSPDLLAIAKQNMDQQKMLYERELSSLKIDMDKDKMKGEANQRQTDNNLKQQKLDLERENISSRNKIENEKLKIARQKPKTSK